MEVEGIKPSSKLAFLYTSSYSYNFKERLLLWDTNGEIQCPYNNLKLNPIHLPPQFHPIFQPSRVRDRDRESLQTLFRQ